MVAGRHRPLGAAVQLLVLQHQHGVAVVQRGQQQALGVRGRGRGHHLEAGHVAEPRLHVLRVERPRAQAPAHREAHHQGHGGVPAVAGGGHVVDQLVEPAAHEVAELHLHHRPEAVEGQAQGGADGARLDDRRVAHPVGPELGRQALGGLEHAAVAGDVLAQQHHPVVGRQRRAQGVVDRVDVAGLGRVTGRGGGRDRGPPQRGGGGVGPGLLDRRARWWAPARRAPRTGAPRPRPAPRPRARRAGRGAGRPGCPGGPPPGRWGPAPPRPPAARPARSRCPTPPRGLASGTSCTPAAWARRPRGRGPRPGSPRRARPPRRCRPRSRPASRSPRPGPPGGRTRTARRWAWTGPSGCSR